MYYIFFFFFFFNDTATTEIYTLSLHDALPISQPLGYGDPQLAAQDRQGGQRERGGAGEGRPGKDDRRARRGEMAEELRHERRADDGGQAEAARDRALQLALRIGCDAVRGERVHSRIHDSA